MINGCVDAFPTDGMISGRSEGNIMCRLHVGKQTLVAQPMVISGEWQTGRSSYEE